MQIKTALRKLVVHRKYHHDDNQDKLQLRGKRAYSEQPPEDNNLLDNDDLPPKQKKSASCPLTLNELVNSINQKGDNLDFPG